MSLMSFLLPRNIYIQFFKHKIVYVIPLDLPEEKEKSLSGQCPQCPSGLWKVILEKNDVRLVKYLSTQTRDDRHTADTADTADTAITADTDVFSEVVFSSREQGKAKAEIRGQQGQTTRSIPEETLR